MGVGSGEQGALPPWIFKHGTNIVDRGLKVVFFDLFLLFFGLFSVGPLWKRLNSVIFLAFFANFLSFFYCPLPLGKFSADALGWAYMFLLVF